MSKSYSRRHIRAIGIVSILAVYVGASWAVLQGIAALQEALSLPAWVTPVARFLLAIGFLIIGATAWIQSHPRTAIRKGKGEVPGEWQLAPRALLASLVAGEVPHLTWARSILGGVFALSLLFSLAGLAVLFQSHLVSSTPSAGSEAAVPDASVSAPPSPATSPVGIAVLPFEAVGRSSKDMSGPDDDVVALLSARLDGMGGHPTLDRGAVLSRWRENGGDTSATYLGTSLQAAASSGARFAVVGNLEETPSDIRIQAEIYDLLSGTRVARARVEGAPQDMTALADELSADLRRQFLDSRG